MKLVLEESDVTVTTTISFNKDLGRWVCHVTMTHGDFFGSAKDRNLSQEDTLSYEQTPAFVALKKQCLRQLNAHREKQDYLIQLYSEDIQRHEAKIEYLKESIAIKRESIAAMTAALEV